MRVKSDRNVRILRMHAEGLNGTQIATQLKMSKSSVYAVLYRTGLAAMDATPTVRSDGKPFLGPYSEADLETLRRDYRAKVPHKVIAKKLGRSVDSVAKRLSDMRRTGDLSVAASAQGQLHGHHVNIKFEPCVKLGDDRRLVREVLAEGGFPQAVTLPNGRTFWITRDGQQWQHRTVQKLPGRRLAA